MCKLEIYVAPQLGIPLVHALPSIKIFQKHSYRALLFSSFNMEFLFLKNIHLFYLAKKSSYTWCRRNQVGSLPRGLLTVVDESVEVRVKKPDGDTERKRQRLDKFVLSA